MPSGSAKRAWRKYRARCEALRGLGFPLAERAAHCSTDHIGREAAARQETVQSLAIALWVARGVGASPLLRDGMRSARVIERCVIFRLRQSGFDLRRHDPAPPQLFAQSLLPPPAGCRLVAHELVGEARAVQVPSLGETWKPSVRHREWSIGRSIEFSGQLDCRASAYGKEPQRTIEERGAARVPLVRHRPHAVRETRRRTLSSAIASAGTIAIARRQRDYEAPAAARMFGDRAMEGASSSELDDRQDKSGSADERRNDADERGQLLVLE